LKLIFKKKGQEIVSRFHPTCAISSKNPMTNHVSNFYRLIGFSKLLEKWNFIS
jgi:hypothetical protein